MYHGVKHSPDPPIGHGASGKAIRYPGEFELKKFINEYYSIITGEIIMNTTCLHSCISSMDEKFEYLDLIYTGRPPTQYTDYPICLAKAVDSVWDVKMPKRNDITFSSEKGSFTMCEYELGQVFANEKDDCFDFKNCVLQKTSDGVTWTLQHAHHVLKRTRRKRKRKITITKYILWNGLRSMRTVQKYLNENDIAQHLVSRDTTSYDLVELVKTLTICIIMRLISCNTNEDCEECRITSGGLPCCDYCDKEHYLHCSRDGQFFSPEHIRDVLNYTLGLPRGVHEIFRECCEDLLEATEADLHVATLCQLNKESTLSVDEIIARSKAISSEVPHLFSIEEEYCSNRVLNIIRSSICPDV